MGEEGFRVERVVLRHLRVPMREPFRISNGVASEKESIIVELHSDGFIGYGEASPMSGSFYSSETPETTWDALATDLIPDLLSMTVSDPVEYAKRLDAYGKEPFARAGIEGAVWDLHAAKLGTTIRELFGAPIAPIPSGLAVGIYDTVDELLDRIALSVTDGYQRVKIKIMPGWDVDPLEAVRKRFGNIPLMVDANAAYNIEEHGELLRSLDHFNLMMIEQPLGATALADMAELAQRVKTPICVDESADSMTALENIIRLGAASIINIKVQRVGGLWNATRMLARAREACLACWLGTMPELGIASDQGLAIASLPGFVYPTDIEASDRWFIDDIINPPITIDKDGTITPPERGYTVDTLKLERYSTHTQTFDA